MSLLQVIEKAVDAVDTWVGKLAKRERIDIKEAVCVHREIFQINNIKNEAGLLDFAEELAVFLFIDGAERKEAQKIADKLDITVHRFLH